MWLHQVANSFYTVMLTFTFKWMISSPNSLNFLEKPFCLFKIDSNFSRVDLVCCHYLLFCNFLSVFELDLGSCITAFWIAGSGHSAVI